MSYLEKIPENKRLEERIEYLLKRYRGKKGSVHDINACHKDMARRMLAELYSKFREYLSEKKALENVDGIAEALFYKQKNNNREIKQKEKAPEHPRLEKLIGSMLRGYRRHPTNPWTKAVIQKFVRSSYTDAVKEEKYFDENEELLHLTFMIEAQIDLNAGLWNGTYKMGN